MSMTGFGDARTPSVHVEIRSVNNRHLKVSVRGSDPYPMLEADVEKVVRRHVKRGSILVQVRAERTATVGSARLNSALMKSYIQQIHADLPNLPPSDRSALLMGVLALPGVAPSESSTTPEDEWPAVESALETALKALNSARAQEGAQMGAELQKLAIAIDGELVAIRSHMPGIAANYRRRLLDRVKDAIAEAGATLEPEQLIREVAIFADRIDVDEEMTRLSGHLAAFDDLLRGESDSPGRRLEFVVQEMGREVNTLGSKAGDTTVSRRVIEIKANLERIRELVQNVE